MAGGKHGHFGLIMKVALYATLAMVTSWEDPDYPGSRSTIATNATVPRRHQAYDTYGKALQIF